MNKKKLYIICACLTILSLVGIGISAIIISKFPNHWWTMLVSIILTVVLLVLTCVIYFPNAEFVCTKCHKQFKPSTFSSIMSIHTITRRYLRCPHCNKLSWCKGTWNNKNK
ncbi:MAG: hypothetical protein J6Q13_03535 [Clostridia bacterium]|nr:hypothetical protein [Clostridia bacterium]